MVLETFVAAALVAYNNLLNFWPPFSGPLYVPLNVAASAALVLIAFGPLGLSAGDVGLAGGGLGFVAGAAIGAVPGAVAIAAARHRRAAPLLADRRVAGLARARLAYQVFVRVPVGTAAFEELAFRGVLFAVWGSEGVLAAALASSAAFALWHIAPTVILVRANRPEARLRAVAGALAGALVLTGVAGVGLCWLRVATDGLWAPFAAHAALNSSATIAGVSAARVTG